MATLIVKLKQHTPIIHFQHYQDGATLRASELKPKLDKFLLKYFVKEKIDYKKWLIGNGQHPALNYKVKVIPPTVIKYYLPFPTKIDTQRFPQRSKNLKDYIKENTFIKDLEILSPTPYFGNADKVKFNGDEVNERDTKINELRYATYTNETIELIFNIWDENLKNHITDLIIDFFLIHNFGTRQNKGFGSYTVEQIENSNYSIDESKIKNFFIVKSKNSFNNFNDIFSSILKEYQLLKSGQNYRTYSKSKLFEYFVKKGVRWEKRFIKKSINLNSNKLDNRILYSRNNLAPIDFNDASKRYYNDWEDKQKNNYKFIRALLGLADHYEFLIDYNGDYDRNAKFIVNIKHKPKNGEDKIERIPSPLFFKVINGVVYIGIDCMYQALKNGEILNKYIEIFKEKFNFELKYQDTTLDLGNLNVPDKFDLKDFIENCKSENWIKL